MFFGLQNKIQADIMLIDAMVTLLLNMVIFNWSPMSPSSRMRVFIFICITSSKTYVAYHYHAIISCNVGFRRFWWASGDLFYSRSPKITPPIHPVYLCSVFNYYPRLVFNKYHVLFLAYALATMWHGDMLTHPYLCLLIEGHLVGRIALTPL